MRVLVGYGRRNNEDLAHKCGPRVPQQGKQDLAKHSGRPNQGTPVRESCPERDYQGFKELVVLAEP